MYGFKDSPGKWNDANCDTKTGFICEAIVSDNIPTEVRFISPHIFSAWLISIKFMLLLITSPYVYITTNTFDRFSI